MADSLIAGITLVHGAVLVTRNRKHFERVGRRLVQNKGRDGGKQAGDG